MIQRSFLQLKELKGLFIRRSVYIQKSYCCYVTGPQILNSIFRVSDRGMVRCNSFLLIKAYSLEKVFYVQFFLIILSVEKIVHLCPFFEGKC